MNSTLKIARNEITATPMTMDIFSEPFALQIFDEGNAEVFNDANMTLQRLSELAGP